LFVFIACIALVRAAFVAPLGRANADVPAIRGYFVPFNDDNSDSAVAKYAAHVAHAAHVARLAAPLVYAANVPYASPAVAKYAASVASAARTGKSASTSLSSAAVAKFSTSTDYAPNVAAPEVYNDPTINAAIDKAVLRSLFYPVDYQNNLTGDNKDQALDGDVRQEQALNGARVEPDGTRVDLNALQQFLNFVRPPLAAPVANSANAQINSYSTPFASYH
jgi:hypothetical protein